jgi:hypothetical protein
MVQLTAVAIAGAAVHVDGCFVAHVHCQQDSLAIGMASGDVGMDGIERAAPQPFALASGVDHETAQGDGAIGQGVVAQGGGASVDAHIAHDIVIDDQGQRVAARAHGHVGQGIPDTTDEWQLLVLHAQGKDTGPQVGIHGHDAKGTLHAAIMGPV